VVSPGRGDLDRGLFSISVAAELAGLHPQTLRIHEREGLIDPARSAGGTRRYSPFGALAVPSGLGDGKGKGRRVSDRR
jgi:hypothetical protein